MTHFRSYSLIHAKRVIPLVLNIAIFCCNGSVSAVGTDTSLYIRKSEGGMPVLQRALPMTFLGKMRSKESGISQKLSHTMINSRQGDKEAQMETTEMQQNWGAEDESQAQPIKNLLNMYYMCCCTKTAIQGAAIFPERHRDMPVCRNPTLDQAWKDYKAKATDNQRFSTFADLEIELSREFTERNGPDSYPLMWLKEWLGAEKWHSFVDELKSSDKRDRQGIKHFREFVKSIRTSRLRWLQSPERRKWKTSEDFRRAHLKILQEEEKKWNLKWQASPLKAQFKSWQEFKSFEISVDLGLGDRRDTSNSTTFLEAQNPNDVQNLPNIELSTLGLSNMAAPQDVSNALDELANFQRLTPDERGLADLNTWVVWEQFREELRNLIRKNSCGPVYNAKVQNFGICCIFTVNTHVVPKDKFSPYSFCAQLDEVGASPPPDDFVPESGVQHSTRELILRFSPKVGRILVEGLATWAEYRVKFVIKVLRAEAALEARVLEMMEAILTTHFGNSAALRKFRNLEWSKLKFRAREKELEILGVALNNMNLHAQQEIYTEALALVSRQGVVGLEQDIGISDEDRQEFSAIHHFLETDIKEVSNCADSLFSELNSLILFNYLTPTMTEELLAKAISHCKALSGAVFLRYRRELFEAAYRSTFANRVDPELNAQNASSGCAKGLDGVTGGRGNATGSVIGSLLTLSPSKQVRFARTPTSTKERKLESVSRQGKNTGGADTALVSPTHTGNASSRNPVVVRNDVDFVIEITTSDSYYNYDFSGESWLWNFGWSTGTRFTETSNANACRAGDTTWCFSMCCDSVLQFSPLCYQNNMSCK